MRHANHAQRMIKFLESKKDISNSCPSDFLDELIDKHYFRGNIKQEAAVERASRKYCLNVCRVFIGLKNSKLMCPCTQLGCEEAVKRTWLALEEKGFINNDDD